jgi:hypothetical protein
MADARPSAILPANWDVPREFRERLGDQVGRQRLMQAEGHLLLILHAPPGEEADEREGRVFWREPGGRWTPAGTSPAQRGVSDLLSEYEKSLDLLQQAEDKASTARDYFQLLNRLNPITRAARNLYQVLQDAREAKPDDRSLILWRDRAYVISRTAELLHNDAKNALDFAVAQRTEEEAASTRRVETAAHRLNVLAALFLPFAMIEAVFGTSLHHGLEALDAQHQPLVMAGVMLAGILMGVVLMLFITRKP